MRLILVARVVATIVGLYVLFFALPIVIAIIFEENTQIMPFAIPGIVVLLLVIVFLIGTRRFRGNLHLRQGLLTVPLSWVCVSLVGAIPYVISGAIPSFINAFFETASGLTTTGATILTEIEALPRTILFWRALTHWLGGMGIVVLTVAVFPLIGIGGNTLLAAETTGPALEKITPRIAHMAKIFWLIYFFLTFLQMVCLMFAGLGWFDAITHAFATMATGGFSIYNSSLIGASPLVKIIITVFMISAGINFSLYFLLITGSLAALWKDTEFKTYISIFVIATLLIIGDLLVRLQLPISEALIDSAFQVASILTTTGFVSMDFEQWPYFAQTVLFTLMFIGGSAGSTGGGIKVIRIIIVMKYIFRELTHFFMPLKIQRISINKRALSEDYVRIVLLFIVSYVVLIVGTTFVVSLGGYDILTSFTTALATLGNIGPGFGGIGATDNYAFFAPSLKVFLSLIMIAGRLELFTMLVIFSPRFWR